jgi:Protein of unknown function (DUF4058)
MPIHDWSRVPAGLFHHFHQDWSIEIARTLNRGRLPKGLSALVEQRSGPDQVYASRANRVVVKHHLGRIVAVIEIVSPGNKDSRAAIRDFVEKTVDFLRKGVHVLDVDLFPPTPRDPYGIHKAIWDEIIEEDFTFPEGKDRILVSYQTGGERAAYIEPIGVGDPLPDMPLFLTTDLHIMVSLEPTYQTTWHASPAELRDAVETGVVPDPDAE